MSTASSAPCPACGTVSAGNFCSGCGAPRASGTCPSCRGAVAPGARFCSQCGTAVAAGPARQVQWAWVVAGLAVLAVVLVLVWRSAPPTPAAPGGTTGDPAAIDLASMTPRERFDRLYDRVMRAAEQGDAATVGRFAPMALAAYEQLDARDADARYHAAMIRMHTDDPAGAAALADTIRAEAPSHLFSFVIHATLARQRNDPARQREEEAGFLAAYDAEIAAGREEYQQHRFILDQMLEQARRTP